MDRSSLRTSLASLLLRSRQALSLYTQMCAQQKSQTHRAQQIEQWRSVNAELVESLGRLIPFSHDKMLASAFVLRDHFYSQWRELESRLVEQQKNIIALSEQGDFAKTALLAHEAMLAKAKMQASQAAFNEIENSLKTVAAHRPVMKSQLLETDSSLNDKATPTFADEFNSAISKAESSKSVAKVLQFNNRRSAI